MAMVERTYNIVANKPFIKSKPNFTSGTIKIRFNTKRKPTDEDIVGYWVKQFGINPSSLSSVPGLEFDVSDVNPKLQVEPEEFILEDAGEPDITGLGFLIAPETELITEDVSITEEDE